MRGDLDRRQMVTGRFASHCYCPTRAFKSCLICVNT